MHSKIQNLSPHTVNTGGVPITCTANDLTQRFHSSHLVRAISMHVLYSETQFLSIIF